MFRPFIILIVSILVSGCVGAAQVGKKEVRIYSENLSGLNTIDGNTKYAQLLSDEYLKQAATASDTQDAISLGVIGAAATGAGGLLFNSGFDLIKGAGLAAGTTTAVGNYLKPGETVLALLNAAEQLVCIAKSGQLAEPIVKPDHDAELAAVEILAIGIRQARINLRKTLVRQRPDYNTLLNQISDTAAVPNKLRNQLSEKEMVEKLRDDVNKCLLIAI